MNFVDVKPIREAFLNSGLTGCEVARRLDWYRFDGQPDSSRVTRQLGIVKHQSNGRKGEVYKTFRKRISYDAGLMYAEALGIDPIDLGL